MQGLVREISDCYAETHPDLYDRIWATCSRGGEYEEFNESMSEIAGGIDMALTEETLTLWESIHESRRDLAKYQKISQSRIPMSVRVSAKLNALGTQ